MQQGGEGEGGSKSQYGVPSEMSPSPLAAAAAITSRPMGIETDQPQLVEAASPISSRPPASGAVNLDELMSLQVQGGGADEDALAAAGDEGDRGEGVGSGNRWPRQETLALLKIRSEMDAAFRDATLKGPLWENVSRKLAELGYKRSAKKCKEKFENVHKYYKRTKEGRAGRQDGKSYKFFSELEALHSSAPSSSNASASQVVTPNPVVSIGMGMVSNPIPISSIRVPQVPPGFGGVFPSDPSAAVIAAVVSGSATTPTPVHVHVPPRTTTQIGISFSSNSSSSSPESDDDSLEGEPSNVGSSRKRKRVSSKGGSGTRRMMEFFENLMKQVMNKQEVMQQRFLEAIERREQDRMIREEAWKRQEMARLAREHDLMAQDRAISASRDAAIVAFLQKITGQTIQLPTPVSIPVVPPPAPFSMPMPTPTPTPTPPAAPPPSQQHQQQVQHHHHQDAAAVVMAIPEQQVPPQDITMSRGGGSFEPSSSRWPKAEVIALIKLRSGLESRYQEVGPKGPLWEDISAGMQRMGYKRSAKRCKEKWENINKYYKKVKESNKRRPEDAKTCPYFHQLDALYRKKILGGSSSGGQNRPEQQQQENIILDPISATKPPVPVLVPVPAPALQEVMPTIQVEQHNTVGASTAESENKNEATTDVQAQASASRSGILFGGEPKKPEDIVKELMEQQKNHQQLIEDDYDNIDEEEEEEEDEDDEVEEERKMGNYKIDFQRQSAWPSNEEENGTTSFLAVV